MPRKKKREHLYRIVAKIGEFEKNPDGTRAAGYPSVTYRTSNLVLTYKFLKATYPNFKFMNVFDRKTDSQVASFTIKDPPAFPRLKMH